jgi:hypothetical protein
VATGKKSNFITFKIFGVISLLALLFGYGLIRDVYTGDYKEYGKHKTIKIGAMNDRSVSREIV